MNTRSVHAYASDYLSCFVDVPEEEEDHDHEETRNMTKAMTIVMIGNYPRRCSPRRRLFLLQPKVRGTEARC